MTVDTRPKSPFKGAIYASYDDFSQGINAVVSRDGGLSWSAPATIVPFTTTIDDGSLPVVAPDGSVYVFFTSDTGRFGSLSIRFVKSGDGGGANPITPGHGRTPGLLEIQRIYSKLRPGQASLLGRGHRHSHASHAHIAPPA